MKRRLTILTIIASVSISYAAERPKTPDEVMAFAAKKTEGYKNLTADFAYRHSERGLPMETTGTVVWARSQQWRVEGTTSVMGFDSESLLLLGRDRVLWVEEHPRSGTTVCRADASQVLSNGIDAYVSWPLLFKVVEPGHLWTELKKEYDFTNETNEVVEEQTMFAISGSLKKEIGQKMANPKLADEIESVTGECRILVGAEDGFIHVFERGVEFKMKEAQFIPNAWSDGVVLLNTRFNETDGGDRFVYKPPEGVAVQEFPRKVSRDRPKSQPRPAPSPSGEHKGLVGSWTSIRYSGPLEGTIESYELRLDDDGWARFVWKQKGLPKFRRYGHYWIEGDQLTVESDDPSRKESWAWKYQVTDEGLALSTSNSTITLQRALPK